MPSFPGFDIPMDVPAWMRRAFDVLGNSALGKYPVVDERWHFVGESGEPEFRNTWVNYDNGVTFERAAYKRTASGVVWVKGFVKGSTAFTTIFYLPEGYRPLLRRVMPGQRAAFGGGAETSVRVDVYPDGTVSLDATAPAGTCDYLSIEFSFLGEQ